MKQFDVFSWCPPGWPEPHPAIIVSDSSRAANKPLVEVVMCASKQAGRKAESHEIILDTVDGFDRPTLCKCDLIYAVPREELKNHRGQVSPKRRGHLIRTIIAAHEWGSVLTAS